MNRRTYLGGLVGGLAAVAGCSEALTGPETDGTSGERLLEYDESSVGSRARGEAEFRTYVESMGAAYGSQGIYGRDEASEGDLEFGGAWTQPLEHGAEVTSDHTLVLYRLPDADDGTPAAALWLWSAVDVEDTDGTVERVETAVDLPGDGASMSIYDPGGDHRADRTDAYTIGTARLDIAGLSATMPLPAGTVSLDPERTAVGDAGGYAPLWTGSHDGTVGLLATCEIRWPAGTEQELTWSMAVETAGI